MKVLILGTGFAGEGHTDAFRSAGADVVGIVGRTPSVVSQVAEKLGISYHGTDWQAALEVCQPDIVSIATPGGAHYEPFKQAIEFGCHVFCDKPMTQSGETAVELYELAKKRGVKTAYAASFRFTPFVLYAKRLVAEGAIGEPVEVECMSQFNLKEASLSCGHYDGSGEFAYRVGFPGKSGVGGGIMAVVLGKASIAVCSPGLNRFGNSQLGTLALEEISLIAGWSVFSVN